MIEQGLFFGVIIFGLCLIISVFVIIGSFIIIGVASLSKEGKILLLKIIFIAVIGIIIASYIGDYFSPYDAWSY